MPGSGAMYLAVTNPTLPLNDKISHQNVRSANDRKRDKSKEGDPPWVLFETSRGTK